VSDDLIRLVADLENAPVALGRQTRGVMAKQLDQVAAAAQAEALATWTTYGRGMAGSAGTIRARMSASVGARGGRSQIGYVFADGDGAWFQEHGTGHHPPQPVLGHRADTAADQVAEALGDMLEQLFT
jgi:hypothetical protein